MNKFGHWTKFELKKTKSLVYVLGLTSVGTPGCKHVKYVHIITIFWHM